MIGFVSSAFSGFSHPFRGVKFLIGRPRLWPFVAIPVGVNIVLYSAAAWFFSTRIGDWLNLLIDRGEGWYWAALFYVLATLALLLLLIFASYTFTLVGNLILSPFNDLISERVEWMVNGRPDETKFNLSQVMSGALRAFTTALGRLTLYLGGFLALLLLLLFPPVGTAIYAVVAPLYSLFFLAWEFFDYPMDRHGFDFKRKRKFALANSGAFLGFGAATWLLTIIPFLGLILLPACVIGATLHYCEMQNKGLIPASQE
jgi:CysZ protein